MTLRYFVFVHPGFDDERTDSPTVVEAPNEKAARDSVFEGWELHSIHNSKSGAADEADDIWRGFDIDWSGNFVPWKANGGRIRSVIVPKRNPAPRKGFKANGWVLVRIGDKRGTPTEFYVNTFDDGKVRETTKQNLAHIYSGKDVANGVIERVFKATGNMHVIQFTPYRVRMGDTAIDRFNVRGENPAPRRVGTSTRAPSMITRKRPSARLIKRRRKNVKRGYFPNPREPDVSRLKAGDLFPYEVQGGWRVIEVVGHHKGQTLTFNWPALYASEVNAKAAIAAHRKRNPLSSRRKDANARVRLGVKAMRHNARRGDLAGTAFWRRGVKGALAARRANPRSVRVMKKGGARKGQRFGIYAMVGSTLNVVTDFAPGFKKVELREARSTTGAVAIDRILALKLARMLAAIKSYKVAVVSLDTPLADVKAALA